MKKEHIIILAVLAIVIYFIYKSKKPSIVTVGSDNYDSIFGIGKKKKAAAASEVSSIKESIEDVKNENKRLERDLSKLRGWIGHIDRWAYTTNTGFTKYNGVSH